MGSIIKNKIRFECSEERLKEILETIKIGDENIGTFDFNKILPMPEALNIEHSKRTTDGFIAYKQFLSDNMPRKTISEEAFLRNNPTISEETWRLGKTAYQNVKDYGFPTWCEYCCVNWGTKGNAFNSSFENNELYFDTVWLASHPIMEKLSDMFPEVQISHDWASQNIGSNCGSRKWLGGIKIDEQYPEGKAAYDFSMEMWNGKPSDFDLVLNSTGTKYIYVEDDTYDLIEVCDKAALFTNERINAVDIPKGLYCYHLRESEVDGSFASIEPYVRVNHGGSVITRELIEFGEDKIIEFTDETAPNFLGSSLTLGEFMRGEYTLDEENEYEMGKQSL